MRRSSPWKHSPKWAIPWNVFPPWWTSRCAVLEDVLLTKECKTPAGRKPIDVVLMFKVIFLQRYYGLGDHQIQYQIIDRTSFRQFLGIHTVAEIPDEKTMWACRDKLGKAGTFDLLFDEFRAYLDSLCLSFNEGKNNGTAKT